MNLIRQCGLFLFFYFFKVNAIYNKNVVCVLKQGMEPICLTSRSGRRQISNLPSHDPYIPRSNVTFYNCSSIECKPLTLNSITQLASPKLKMKTCFELRPGESECENIRFPYFKDVDKILFLTQNIRNKNYFFLDCVGDKNVEICHKYLNESKFQDVLSQLEPQIRAESQPLIFKHNYLCEQNNDGTLICDLNQYLPYASGLQEKSWLNTEANVIAKVKNLKIPLQYSCADDWCGRIGYVPARRSEYTYLPPGDRTFRCYYANKQQICKAIDPSPSAFNLNADLHPQG